MTPHGKHLIPLIAIGVLTLCLNACGKPEGPAEKAGKEIDKTMQSAGEKVDKAAQSAGQEVDKAAQSAGEKIEQLGEKIQEKAKDASK